MREQVGDQFVCDLWEIKFIQGEFLHFLVLLLDHVDKDKDKDYCHDEEDLLRDNMESTKAAENTEKTKNLSDLLTTMIVSTNQTILTKHFLDGKYLEENAC